MTTIAAFREHILEAGILDPKGSHHAFVHGGHGRKLNFDRIAADSPLYGEWVAITEEALQQRQRELGAALLAAVGVANGTNQLATDIAARMDVLALTTEKVSSRAVTLTDESRRELTAAVQRGGLVVILEDVGTTGGTACTAALSALTEGATELEGLFTWQRTPQLDAWERVGLPYRAIIHEPLPTYAPEACRTAGYCALGWELIPHGS